jgi:hypothetical protein
MNMMEGSRFFMSQQRDKGYSQKGKPNANTGKRLISAEELELAIHPTKRQNSPQ